MEHPAGNKLSQSQVLGELRKQIKDAFRLTSELTTETLYESFVVYRYGGGHGDTAKRPEERKRWTEITDKYLQNYWSGLTYLSLESFVFYLPRIMIFLIDVEMERKQDFLDLFIFCIMNSFSRGSMPNLPSLLNAPQLEVVKQFILCSNRLTDDESILKMRSKIISQLKGNI